METIICTGGEYRDMIDLEVLYHMTCVSSPYNEIITLSWQVEEYDVVYLVTVVKLRRFVHSKAQAAIAIVHAAILIITPLS